ncbi:MAG: cupredoxin domain-containing protein [Candidatus Paceibacterota bacterium]|jgi:hypothetical protein
MDKKNLIPLIIVIVFIGGMIFLFSGKSSSDNQIPNNQNSNNSQTQGETTDNVKIVDGKQIIEIKVKGGYTPRVTVAKAGIPTILRFETKGTFDCSAYIRIPSIGVGEMLLNSGTKDITIDNPEAGKLQGMCGMGMYQFEVDFK